MRQVITLYSEELQQYIYISVTEAPQCINEKRRYLDHALRSLDNPRFTQI